MKIKEALEFFDAQMKKHTARFPRPVKRARLPAVKELDPITFAVIKSKMDGTVSEMVETVRCTARNPILYAAKDLACAIFTYDSLLLTLADSCLPGLSSCLDTPLWAIIEAYKDDIHPGDAFVNNDPYYGNSHVGDFSMYAPIFYEGELVAWAATVCHLIDIGAHVPLSLDPFAKDVYEEGIHFPPMRLCKNHQEIPEMIRFIKANFRYPEQWHGDFLAQVGSLWTGERRVLELCKKYGCDAVKQFQDEYLDYGDRRMTEEIRKLPKGEWSTEALSEKIDPLCPDGALLRVTMMIDPNEAMIYFDLTEMPDNLPWGFNASYARSKAACILGSLPSFNPTLPRNDGVYRHFKVYMREGALVGIPKWPVGTSCSTHGIINETTGIILNLWEQVQSGLGHGTGGDLSVDPNFAGVDFRRDNEPFSHLCMLVMSGGPASKGCDGWPNWKTNGAMGGMYCEGIEIFELKVPLIVWELRVQVDSGGAGKWRGGVGFLGRIQPRQNGVKLMATGTGCTFLPLGAAGGKPGCLAKHWIENHNTGKKVKDLTNVSRYDLRADEEWVGFTNGGGGYGNPLERDPELVKDDVRNYIVSMKAAHDEYGVVLKTELELYEVDYEASGKLRSQLRKERMIK